MNGEELADVAPRVAASLGRVSEPTEDRVLVEVDGPGVQPPHLDEESLRPRPRVPERRPRQAAAVAEAHGSREVRNRQDAGHDWNSNTSLLTAFNEIKIRIRVVKELRQGAICASISLAGALLEPIAPTLLPEISIFKELHWSFAATQAQSIDRIYFHARGPPVA